MIKAMKTYEYDPDYAVPPGESVKEVMESLGMTQKELAQRLGLTIMTLNRIFKGEQPITYDTANRLEMVTGTPARFWNTLEVNYQEQRNRLAERERLQNDLEWLKRIPVKELIERGAIQPAEDKCELLHNALCFYGVSSVQAWKEIWEAPTVAARRSHCFESVPGPASAWIRLGERQALQRDCALFEKTALKNALPAIRALTQKTPEEFEQPLIELCASCGIAVALVKEMKKVPWNGATKWLTPVKPMVLLNLRGKGEDKFWFSLFHELAHVLHDNKKELYIADGSNDPREQAADLFAAETLVPARFNIRIKAMTRKAEIKALAKELGVSPGIIAGRYQHLTRKWSWFKDQIRTFEWKQ